jgi:hypothetical protein
MPTKLGPLSAKNFKDPLLLALGELSKYQVGKEINFEKTYAPVFNRMGLTDLEAYGRTANKILWVERWVQFAFQGLCEESLTARIGRGKWALTPKGVQEVLTKVGSLAKRVEEELPKKEELPPEEKSENEPVLVAGLSILIGPGFPPDLYHEDPYIRGLAAKSISCLGAFSDIAPTCKDCPLRNACGNASAAVLSRLAAELEEKDKLSPEEIIEKASIIIEDSLEKTKEQQKWSWVSTTPMNIVNIGQDLTCAFCGVSVTSGTSCVWVHQTGATPGVGSGVFHKECYTQITGKSVK